MRVVLIEHAENIVREMKACFRGCFPGEAAAVYPSVTGFIGEYGTSPPDAVLYALSTDPLDFHLQADRIRAVYPEVPVIVYGEDLDSESIVRGTAAGVSVVVDTAGLQSGLREILEAVLI
jgi:DNA-binding NarL/FixJ family response regulator